MVLDAKQRQKKLAKKAARRKAQLSDKRASGSNKSSLIRAVGAPVHACFVPENLFTTGIGSLSFSRLLPTGEIALAMFLVDVYCLGVKNAFYQILSQQEYELYVGQMSGEADLEAVHPSCLRKLVEGAVRYANRLGFAPHPDYRYAAKLFGDIDAAACPVRYTYGKDGKPTYIQGPYENTAQIRRILDTLSRRLGPDEFHFMIGDGDEPAESALRKPGAHLQLVEYEVTDEPIEEPAFKRLPEAVKEQIREFYDDWSLQGSNKMVALVQPLIEQYPDVPQLYNYLYKAYRILGDQARASHILTETRQRFPNYLFARINHAEVCLRQGEHDKVEEIFGGKYDLKFLYPNRNRFHISEVVGFYTIMAWYYHERGEPEAAHGCYNILQDLDPRHPSTRFIKQLLEPSPVRKLLQKLLPR